MPAPLDSALANFFVGSWNRAGEFSSGKPVASRMIFASTLENHWLELHHDDLPPNGFHAVSEWGVNLANGRFTSVMHDNFGNVRLFLSSGWTGHTITLDDAMLGESEMMGNQIGTQASARRERFTYTAESRTALRMRYEVSLDSGQTWKLGDNLVCTRVTEK